MSPAGRIGAGCRLVLVVAYRAAVRTRLVISGILVAAATSLVGMIVLFVSAAAITPGLAVAPLQQPVLGLILSVYVAVPLVYSSLFGVMGGWCGRWTRQEGEPSPGS